MTRRMLTSYLALAGLAAVAAGVTSGRPYGDLLYFGAYLSIVVAVCWSAVSRRRSGDRMPWLYVAVGQVAWLAGDAVYPISTLLQRAEDGSASAVLWTIGYLAYGAALVAMARRRAGRWLRPAVLDMLTLTVASSIVIWVVFVSPYLAELAADPLGAYLYVMAPLGDIGIVAGVLLLVLSPGRRTGATRLLLLSAVLRIVADLGGSFIPSIELAIAVSTGVILLSNSLLVAAALHVNSNELTVAARQAPTLHPARVWFLGVGLLTAPAVLFARHEYVEAERVLLFAATLATAAFILARFATALRSLEQAERTLSYRSRHDALTGLLNRTALGDELDACPPGSTVLYLDLDGFKTVNDTAGHAAGDTILQTVSQRLKAAVRECDLVARLGGDEFVVVLTGLDSADGIRVADRILHDVAMPVEHDGAWYTVGASIGIASPATTDTPWRPTALLRAADTAMYQAKRLGRGQWILADTPA
ncbi:diguanylate cyclase (GGDEF)-like protein [Actinoplanes xinjiangensis]|uniref:Diguanylate cyclase (GGDEF)-like protein n=2 Tax=Actinoplanes xinjiangensis TaxID=512350 RepID=A0A316F5V3_9ACTN|nr:diguanylate cyclase (GGDEF)-like protein [Actinoplanes xinjiangensis]